MFKRSAANYSLWPERRQRRVSPLKFVAGSFVLGMACATAYSTFFNFTQPATGQGISPPRAVAPLPIVIAREPRVEDNMPLPAPKPVDVASASRPSRARVVAAKVTLPLIGAPSPRSPATTDTRGDDGLVGEVRLTGAEAAADHVPSLLGGDSEPALLVRGAPAGPADAATKANSNARATTIPMPRAAPAKLVAGKPAGSAGGDDAAVANTPTPRGDAANSAAKPTDAPAARRGVVVLKNNREQPPVLARGADESTPKPVVRAAKPKRIPTSSIRKRAVSSRVVAQKKIGQPKRYAAEKRPQREVVTRRAARPVRRQQDQLGPMIARATQALRAFAGSQGFGFGGF